MFLRVNMDLAVIYNKTPRLDIHRRRRKPCGLQQLTHPLSGSFPVDAKLFQRQSFCLRFFPITASLRNTKGDQPDQNHIPLRLETVADAGACQKTGSVALGTQI